VRGLGARGIEAQRPEMAGLDDGGGLLGLVARTKKGREKGDRPGSRMDRGQVDKVGSIWRASSPGGRRVVVIAGLPVVAWAWGSG
jgi:hypothetical protein